MRLAAAAVAALLAAGSAFAQTFSGASPAVGTASAPAVRGSIGETARVTRGAFAGPVDPIGITVTTTDDENDACTGSKGADAETCDTPCWQETGGSNGTCSRREALLHANGATAVPRMIVYNTAGVIRSAVVKLKAQHSFYTLDAGMAPGPIIIANGGIQNRPGFREGIHLNESLQLVGEHASDIGEVFEDCRQIRFYCADITEEVDPELDPEDASGPLTTAGGDVRADAAGALQCTTDADCEGVGDAERCRAWPRAAWDPDPDYCGGGGVTGGSLCDGFNHQLPGDASACNDTVVEGCSGLDGISILAAKNVLYRRMMLTLTGDAAADMAVEFQGNVGQRNALLDSIVGFGAHNCHVEANHNYGGAVDVGTGNVAHPSAIGYEWIGNAILTIQARAPWFQAGIGKYARNYRWHANLGPGAGLSFRGPGIASVDVLDNLTRVGPDDTYGLWGWCSSGGGRYCSSDQACGGGEGSCVPLYPSWFHVARRSDTTNHASLFLDGNVATDEDGVPLDPGPSCEFDCEFDFAAADNDRPKRNPVAKGDLSGGGAAAPGTSAWDRRRAAQLTSQAQIGRVNALRLRDGIQQRVGPVQSTPYQEEIWALEAANGSYEDQAHLVAEEPFPYPTYDCEPWDDTDEDGVDDAFEDEHCAGDCDPLAPSSAAGWRWIQRFAHGWAFGDPVPQCEPEPEGPELTACQDGIDNDGDGLLDWPADRACTSPYATAETSDDLAVVSANLTATQLTNCAAGTDQPGLCDFTGTAGGLVSIRSNSSTKHTVTSALDVSSNWAVNGLTLTGATTFNTDSRLVHVHGERIANFDGSDDVVIYGDGAGSCKFDGDLDDSGYSVHANNQYWNGQEGWKIIGCRFEDFSDTGPGDHSEALYIGEGSRHWRIDGNEFQWNGSTGHLFTTPFDFTGTVDGSNGTTICPQNICVTRNDWLERGPRAGKTGGTAFIDINNHDSCEPWLTLYVDPTPDQGATSDGWGTAECRQCNDGNDNDGDGRADFWLDGLGDPQCSGYDDNSESSLWLLLLLGCSPRRRRPRTPTTRRRAPSRRQRFAGAARASKIRGGSPTRITTSPRASRGRSRPTRRSTRSRTSPGRSGTAARSWSTSARARATGRTCSRSAAPTCSRSTTGAGGSPCTSGTR